MPELQQSAANTVALGQSRSCTATFTFATTPGNLVTVIGVSAGGTQVPFYIIAKDTSGNDVVFTFGSVRSVGDLQVTVWYRANCPTLTSISVGSDFSRSIQLRLLEHSGMAQASVLDKLIVQAGTNASPYTGASGNVAQADTLVLSVVASQYASTTQGGFSGGLTRLFETVSPQLFGFFQSNVDSQRSRLTIHQAISSAIASFALASILSSARFWITFLICFKGQSAGPVKLSSTRRIPLASTPLRASTLTVFGPLRAGLVSGGGPMLLTDGDNAFARIGPFNYQYRLGGWSGLLIGEGTPYQLESVDGLEGWELRTSDDELPRGDGALRGVDLMTSRTILFELKQGSDRGGVDNQQIDVEGDLDTLYRALVPQRDTDFDLIWRHPGRPLRLVRVRPVNLIRELTAEETVVHFQKFALLAADPRHYSAFLRQARLVPTSSSGVTSPVTVINAGNGAAFPYIRVSGTQAITRVEVNNANTDINFVVEAALSAGSTLGGDMEARAIGAARSVVTIDGTSKYGAWQQPRTTFQLNPGANELTFSTIPAGAAVTCTLDYRDTYSG